MIACEYCEVKGRMINLGWSHFSTMQTAKTIWKVNKNDLHHLHLARWQKSQFFRIIHRRHSFGVEIMMFWFDVYAFSSGKLVIVHTLRGVKYLSTLEFRDEMRQLIDFRSKYWRSACHLPVTNLLGYLRFIKCRENELLNRESKIVLLLLELDNNKLVGAFEVKRKIF